MRGLKLFLPFAAAGLFLISACTTDKLGDKILTATNLPMDGLQEVPVKQVSANGSMDVVYNKDTRTLSYTIRWNSLSGTPVGSHIHGTASKGFNAGILQDFTSSLPKVLSGTYSGTALIDGVVLKEEELLLGRYYINIHTPINPGGEIRGQIEGLK
jgi:hypothetical protein